MSFFFQQFNKLYLSTNQNLNDVDGKYKFIYSWKNHHSFSSYFSHQKNKITTAFQLKLIDVWIDFEFSISGFFAATSVSVSAWTLVAISVERYYAICHPLRSRRWQTLKHAYRSIALIWISSLVCMLPIAILSKLLPTQHGNYGYLFSSGCGKVVA